MRFIVNFDMIFNKLTFFISLIFLSLIHPNQANCAVAQDSNLVIIERVDDLDGIYDRIVNFSFQSSDGFIWLATQGGLFKYDGSFVEHIDLGIRFENILKWGAIVEDDNNNIWLHLINSIDGEQLIFVISKSKATGRKIKNLSLGLPNMNSKPIEKVIKSYNGGVNLIFRSGEVENYMYNPLSQDFDSSNEYFLEDVLNIKSFTYTEDGYVLVYKNGDVKFWDIKQNRRFLIYSFKNEEPIKVFKDTRDNLKLVNFDRDNNIYSSKIVDYNLNTGDFKETVYDFGYKKGGLLNSLEKIFYDQYNEELLFLFGNYVEMPTKSFSSNSEYYKFILEFQKRKFFSHQLIIDEDTRGVSTREGFYIIKRKKTIFNSLNRQNELFINNSVRRFVSVDDTTMIAEGYSGVVFFNKQNLNLINYHPLIEILDKDYDLGNGEIFRFISLDKDNLLVFNKWDKEFININLKTYQVASLYSDSPANKLNFDLWSAYKLADDQYLMSNAKELFLVDLDKEQVVEYSDEFYNGFDKLKGQPIYQFLDLEGNKILISTSLGVYVAEKDRGIIEQLIFEDPRFPALINDVQVHYAHRVDDDLFCLGTNSRGVIKYSLSKGVIEHVEKINRKPLPAVHYIYETIDSSFVLATNDKLFAVNPEGNKSYTYFVNDGLEIREFNRIAYFLDDDGYLFLGGINGAVKFNPEMVSLKKSSPEKKIDIAKVEWFDVKDLKYKEISSSGIYTDKINLNSHESSVRINLSSISFGEGQVNYFYNLNSSGNEFKEAQDNIIYLDKLDYGKSELSLYAEYNYGSYRSELLSIPVQLSKPFYRRNFFYLFIASALIFGIYVYTMIRERNSIVLRQNLEALVDSRTKENRKQAVELEELTKLKDKFFINISHELKTPLSLIKGPIEKLALNGQFPEKEKMLLDMANSNIQRLSELIKEILDLSKLELGKQEVNLSHLELIDFVKNRVDQFSIRAKTKKVDVHFESNVSSVNGLFDKKMIHTVISNLVDNSLRHAKGIQNLTIKVNVMNEFASIFITDDGNGIPEDKLKYLFDRFHTISTYDNGSSLGIGLAISKEFADLMGGDLMVSSKLEKGTTFTFKLPIIRSKAVDSEQSLEDVSSTTSEELKSENVNQDDKFNILLVEDNKQLAVFIELLLKDKYNVTVKNNGEEAWNYLNQIDSLLPQLIISDIMMPNMDGFELLELIKSESRFQDVGFLFLSARDSKEDILKALRIGVEDYLSKPFMESELLVVVENLLNNYVVRVNSKKAYKEELIKSNSELSGVAGEDAKREVIVLEEGLPLADKEFLEELDKYIAENLERLEFTIEDLSFHLAISSRQLRRKIQKLTGLTPNQYIRKYKMNVARQLLETRSVYSVKELSYKLGFKSSAHFAKLFKNHFGRNPSDFV